MYAPHLHTPIEYLKGVGQARAEILQKELSIRTFEDMLMHYPFRYVDRSQIIRIRDLRPDQPFAQVSGIVVALQEHGAKRHSRLVATLRDNSGEMELVWFQGLRWIRDKINIGSEYLVFGKPTLFGNRINIAHPDIELLSEAKVIGGEVLQPFYNTSEKLKSKGLNSKGIAQLMRNLVAQLKGFVPEVLPEKVIREHSLVSREEALLSIHFPESNEALAKARTRIKFEELFFSQLPLLQHRFHRKTAIPGHRFVKVGDCFSTFYHKHLPFELTEAQKQVLREIRADVGSGKQMNRLLQGDVGSGKTVVALMAMLLAIDNGYQACMMAPTEILAQQHYNTLSRMLQGMNITVELLTGSVKGSQRTNIHKQLNNGTVAILVGTHALIEESVQFSNLGLVVIDEQHRFGVEQRASMWNKNDVSPHILVMTATPIPRSLALTLYGELDYSVIDKMPPGRKPVKTLHYFDSHRLWLFGFMRQQIALGRQVYVVYPLIYESETLDLKDLMDGYESIVRDFPLPQYAVSMVHGQMQSDARDYEMQRFVKGETQIMVATTVIEVGVDIPNASVMVIENAERFGLSQLHQLRGRVGRGADQSYCILMTSYKLTDDARKRIATMVKTNDGFEIANVDLQLRGPGELAGTRQSGVIEFRLFDLAKDQELLETVRTTIEQLLQNDLYLQSAANTPLRVHLKQLPQNRSQWVKIL